MVDVVVRSAAHSDSALSCSTIVTILSCCVRGVFTSKGISIMQRHKMSRGGSESLFSRTAGHSRVHPKNMLSEVQGPGPMRGGIRL